MRRQKKSKWHTLRLIVQDVQLIQPVSMAEKKPFSQIYKCLDEMESEDNQKKKIQELSSDDDQQVQEYIQPIRDMLETYKKSISQHRENTHPNLPDSRQVQHSAKRRGASKTSKNGNKDGQICLAQLDREIYQVATQIVQNRKK